MMNDYALWGNMKLDTPAAQIRRAHPAPNRKARRAEAALRRSQRARVAALNNQRLLPPGAVHPYAA